MEDKNTFLLEFPYILKSSPSRPLNGTQKVFESHEKDSEISSTSQMDIIVTKNSLNFTLF